VAPAAHYHMGGVDVDLDGRTSVAGLWAAGEVARTGVHGANRLASNSLLEALVFGARVARSVSLALPHLGRPTVTPDLPIRPRSDDDGGAEAEIRRLMWQKVGLVRSGEALREALSRLDSLAAALPLGTEAANLATVAHLVATAALARTESRGAHFRADHPRPAEAWRRRILLTPSRDESGRLRLRTEPVPPPATAAEEAFA